MYNLLHVEQLTHTCIIISYTEIVQIQSIINASEKAHVKEPTRTIDTEVAPNTYQLLYQLSTTTREERTTT